MKNEFSCSRSRRLCAALLCIFLFSSGVLSRPAALQARAAGPAAALALDEASMLLWDVLMTLFVGAGAVSSLENDRYDMEASIYEGMVNYYMEQYGAASVSDDMVFTLGDGSRYTLGDLITSARWDIVGTEGCYIPDEATWQRFRVSGSSSQAAFSSVAGVTISESLLAHMAGFAGAVRAGEVAELDPAAYFPAGFDGTLPRDADGNYIVAGHFSGIQYFTYNGQCITVSKSVKLYELYVSTPVVGYYDTKVDRVDMPALIYINFLTLDNKGAVVDYSLPASVTLHRPDGDRTFGQTLGSFHALPGAVSLNIPVFAVYGDAAAYLRALSAADEAEAAAAAAKAGNRALDYPALADALADSFAPLLAKELAPNILLDLYPALTDALSDVLNPDIADTDNPALTLDPAATTDAYKKVVAGTVADVAVSVPAVDMGIDSYKVDLTNIFPFCLPFDFIRLLQVLDAEPVTPCFEFPFVAPALDIDMSVMIDLSFLDTFMETFRLLQTFSFIFFLICITPKMIRW